MENLIGSCHCGNIKFEVKTDLDCPIRCNCSFCQRRGAIVQIVSKPMFSLVKGVQSLKLYGKQKFAKHNFCRNCGIHVFTEITEDDGDKVAVNLNCIDQIELDLLQIMPFDGKHVF